MKKLITTILLATSILSLTACGNAKKKDKVLNIGINQIVEYVALDDNREGFIKALEEAGYKDGDNIKIDYQNAQGDIGVSQIIAKKFVSDKKDLVFAIGTPAAQSVFNSTKETPIIVKHTLDAKIPIIAAEKGSVESGALGTVGIDYYQLGYEAGKMAVSVLKGEDISKMSIKMPSKTEIYINKNTLEKLGINKSNLDNVKYIEK